MNTNSVYQAGNKHPLIIWIDGAYGVGKTSVALKIRESFPDHDIEFLESDCYSDQILKRIIESAKENNVIPDIGSLPQNDINFINEFKKIIEEKTSGIKKIIVDMALTTKECQSELYDYLIYSGHNILHFILTADKSTLKSRILNDTRRDKSAALDYLERNVAFLEQNYQDAIRIRTDNRAITDIANEIMEIVYSQNCNIDLN